MAEINTTKKRKFSKNKKKTWRKHIDIRDVEDYLDDVRHQERTGGIVADKPDEDLFFIESSVTDEQKVEAKGKKLDLSSLRCHSNLRADTKVKPLKVTRNVKTVRDDSTEPVTKRRLLARDQSKQAIQARKARLIAARCTDVTYDLWDVNDPKETEEKNEYLEVTEHKPVKPRKSFYKKPSNIDAVEVAHPGASYNPAFEDYVKLVNLANDVEVIKDKKEKKIKKALHDMFPYASELDKEETYIKEMSEGILNENNEILAEKDYDLERIESDAEEELILTVNPSITDDKRKTTAQINKEKKLLQQVKSKRRVRSLNLHKNQFFRIKSIKKQAEREHANADRIIAKKALIRKGNEGKTKRLGKLKYQSADIEVKLIDELTGNLRTMKPEGNLVEDRFLSLQKRNLIEPRRRANHTHKYKIKMYEKRGHRAITL